MKYVIAFVAAAGLAFAACGGGGAAYDCDAAEKVAESCGTTIRTACESYETSSATGIAGTDCSEYIDCYTNSSECTDTNDTDTYGKITDCYTTASCK